MSFFSKKKFGVVTPITGKHPPKPGRVAIMVSSSLDMNIFSNTLLKSGDGASTRFSQKPLMMSRMIQDKTDEAGFSVTGPMIGSPYAVMVMENLIHWGAESILYVGWAGAVSPLVKTGDVVVADEAFIDEGTSSSYGGDKERPEKADRDMSEDLFNAIQSRRDFPFVHRGKIWTTDAIFMETQDKIEFYQFQNVLAVEMEVSALFAAARFRDIPASAVLAVSDEVNHFIWKPGFNNDAFVNTRKLLCETVLDLCKDPYFPTLKKTPAKK